MGRHGRPQDDALPRVDVAAELDTAPLVEATVPRPSTGARRRRTEPEPPPVAGPEAPPVTEPPSVGRTVVARRDRAAQRAARRAQARRRALLVGAAVLAVLLVAGVTVVLVKAGGGPKATGPASTAPRQSTLLVQVAGADGTAASSALVGITPRTNRGAAVLVPAGLLVDVASNGSMPFGETLTLPQPRAPLDALTDLLGVRVGNGWALTQAGLAALVDKVGGVQATVDVDIIVKDAKGKEVVVARAGNQRLGGPAAAAYATYLADGEPEAVRLARFNDVLDAVLRQLPDSQSAIATLLTGLSTGSRSTQPPQQLAGLLVDLRAAAVKERVHYDVLPVTDIDTGAAVDAYGIDSSKAGPLLQSLFAGSLQKDSSGAVVRVLVENGVGTPDLVDKARAKLVRKGFRFVNGGNASQLSDTDTSVVLIEDGSEQAQARGGRVAAALGLARSTIEINPRGQTVADVIVILGVDFKP